MFLEDYGLTIQIVELKWEDENKTQDPIRVINFTDCDVIDYCPTDCVYSVVKFKKNSKYFIEIVFDRIDSDLFDVQVRIPKLNATGNSKICKKIKKELSLGISGRLSKNEIPDFVRLKFEQFKKFSC